MAGLNESGLPRNTAGWLALRWVRRIFADDVSPDADADADRGRGATWAAADPRLGNLLVLVVDDNPLNVMVASEMLSAWGITALEAADGAQAVVLARDLPLDLILMDLQMPILDGLASAKQIRANERGCASKRVPIVAYTSSSPAGALLQSVGINSVLDKPCDLRTLHDCLTRWCPANAAATAVFPPDAVALEDRCRGPARAERAARRSGA
jgi:CheY-like chemotaxis protein